MGTTDGASAFVPPSGILLTLLGGEVVQGRYEKKHSTTILQRIRCLQGGVCLHGEHYKEDFAFVHQFRLPQDLTAQRDRLKL